MKEDYKKIMKELGETSERESLYAAIKEKLSKLAHERNNFVATTEQEVVTRNETLTIRYSSQRDRLQLRYPYLKDL
jgi:hypothetical protein